VTTLDSNGGLLHAALNKMSIDKDGIVVWLHSVRDVQLEDIAAA
jgi:hypothetical protein